MVYLDNAATTYPKQECVLKALDEANRNAFNSGRGGYNVARHKTKIIDDVRNGFPSPFLVDHRWNVQFIQFV